MGLGVSSLLCGVAVAAEPAPEVLPQRVTLSGDVFSIEFPVKPTCEPKAEVPECHAEDPEEGWLLRASVWTVGARRTPTEALRKHLSSMAQDGDFRIVREEETRVGELPALDYLFASGDGSAYHSSGRLVLVGARLIDLEVGGETTPPEEVVLHFVNTLQVKGAPVVSAPVAGSTPEPQPVVETAAASAPPATPEPVVRSTPEPPPAPEAAPAPLPTTPPVAPASVLAERLQPLAERMQASLLELGALKYQSVHEAPAGEGMPWNISVVATQRTTQRKRDQRRDAVLITEKGKTQTGKLENRYWVDAKTLLPYRWVSQASGSSMRVELRDGILRGESTGTRVAKFEQRVGSTPLLFSGASLELALSTLPLARGFTGGLQMLEPDALATGKPVSAWRLEVPFAGPITGLAGQKQEHQGFRAELIERTELEPRRIILWIDGETRRVLQVESLVPASRGGHRSVQTLQASR